MITMFGQIIDLGLGRPMASPRYCRGLCHAERWQGRRRHRRRSALRELKPEFTRPALGDDGPIGRGDERDESISRLGV